MTDECPSGAHLLHAIRSEADIKLVLALTTASDPKQTFALRFLH